MNRSRILQRTLSALAMVSITVPAAAQMPIMIDEILMADHANRDTDPDGPRVAVDASGRWLTLRSRTERRAHRDLGMVELLELDAADTLTAIESKAQLSADDYRFAGAAINGSRVWGYDGDPLDRGVYKRDFGGPTTALRRSAVDRHPAAQPGDRPELASGAAPTATGIEGTGFVATLLRAPGYILDALKSVYGSEYALILAAGLFVFTVGFAALTDMLRDARRA